MIELIALKHNNSEKLFKNNDSQLHRVYFRKIVINNKAQNYIKNGQGIFLITKLKHEEYCSIITCCTQSTLILDSMVIVEPR